ncbi:MAG: hypothetical protein AB3N11_04950 [Arenibacterium sp.]
MSDDWASYKPFECAPGLRLSAHERLCEIHQQNMNKRLDQIEEMIERLERRLWIAVYGVVAVILAQALQSILTATP